MAVSYGSTETAAALLQHAGTANVIVGLILSALPIFFGSSALIIFAFRLASPLISIVLLLLSYLFVPIGLAVLAFVIAVVIAVLTTIGRRLYDAKHHPVEGDESKSRQAKLRRAYQTYVVIATALTVAVVLVLNELMWLPAESIEIDGLTISGYVISVADSETVILRDHDRKILVLQGRPTNRELCLSRSLIFIGPRWAHRSLVPILMGNKEPPDYRRCPS
jgi:hypothetical protein